MVYGLNYAGRFGEVRTGAARSLNYLKELAKRSPELGTLVKELELNIAEAEEAMDPVALKNKYYANAMFLRGRGPEGKAKK